MKSLTTLLTLLMIFLFSSYTSAQFDLGEKLKKRIDKELEKAADDAIDETVETVKEGGKDKNEEKDKKETEETDLKDAEKNSVNETENNRASDVSDKGTFDNSSFEGRVIFDVEENGKQQLIEYYSKDKRYLMDMPEKGGSILFDSHKLKMYVILNEEKVYMESLMMPLSAGSGGGSITKTGETKSILGYDCEKFLFKQKDTEGEAWMTDELGAFMFFMEAQDEMPEWQSEILDAGYFPLHVTEFDKNGNVESVFNVRKVIPMRLKDDLFVVPPTYEKLDLTNMGGFDKLIGQ